jgi:hypothetical protein
LNVAIDLGEITGPVMPVRQVEPGTLLKLWTEDAFSGRLRSASDRPSERLDMREVNPADRTVRGARSGTG